MKPLLEGGKDVWSAPRCQIAVCKRRIGGKVYVLKSNFSPRPAVPTPNSCMPAPHDQDEASVLVRRALDQHESTLIAYTSGILGGDIERARDVVQDAMLRLYLTEPDRVRENLKSWLFTVCRNRAFDILRKEQRLDIGNDDVIAAAADHEPDPAQNAGTQELYENIWRCVDRLRPNQREVVRLKFLHDCSYQEIAGITGLSVGNVGFIMHHAIKKLRELMGRDMAEENFHILS